MAKKVLNVSEIFHTLDRKRPVQLFLFWQRKMSRYHFASLLGVTLKCNLVNTAYQTRIKPAAYHLNCSRKKSLSVLSSSLVHVFTQLRKVSGIAFKSVVTSQSVTGFLPALFKKELVPRTVPAG